MYSEGEQRDFWNEWNVSREQKQGQVSTDQRRVILRWLDQMGRTDMDILEVGCGAGWLCADLVKYGRVVGTDLSDQVLARAAQRLPAVEFIAGDFLNLDFADRQFDVVVTLETLSHLPDQPGFLKKCARLLKPGGCLLIATQNRTALEKNNVTKAERGQHRRWVDRHELEAMLSESFEVDELFSITPKFNRGVLRVVNSRHWQRPARAIGLSGLINAMTRAQERAWLGWTLMARAHVGEHQTNTESVNT